MIPYYEMTTLEESLRTPHQVSIEKITKSTIAFNATWLSYKQDISWVDKLTLRLMDLGDKKSEA